MQTLKANLVNHLDKWFEITLLELDIIADGDTKEHAIEELEFAITAEYHLARLKEQTPFVDLILPAINQEEEKTNEIGNFPLSLPEEVKDCLAKALGLSCVEQFSVMLISRKEN